MENKNPTQETAKQASNVITNRFDYIAYDEKAKKDQELFKQKFQGLESHVESSLISPRAKALTLTALEEAYMWVGKAIRDDQIKRSNPGETAIQEERSAS